MKLSTAILLILLAIIAGFVWFRTRGRSQKREFRTTDEFVQWLAGQAVQDARRENNTNLDYSVDSIKTVEQILGKAYDQYAKNPSSVSPDGLASAYGAYVGEVIRKNKQGAKWERDDSHFGARSYPLICGTTRAYPMAWCFKRITNGPEDDVWSKFELFVFREELLRKAQTPKAP